MVQEQLWTVCVMFSVLCSVCYVQCIVFSVFVFSVFVFSGCMSRAAWG